MSELPNSEPGELHLEFEYDGKEIFRRYAATLRPFVVRRKVRGPLTVMGHAVKGPIRGKLSGADFYSIVIHEEDGVDVSVGLFRADEIDGIEEGPAPQNGAS
jgi:hypothetical protein